MVTANCSGGVITLTSQRVLTEEQSKKMLEYVKRVKAICKDLHVNETLDAEKHISYIGINYDTSMNLEESLKVLNAAHDHLLAEVDDFVENQTTDHLADQDLEDTAFHVTKGINKILNVVKREIDKGNVVMCFPKEARNPKFLYLIQCLGNVFFNEDQPE